MNKNTIFTVLPSLNSVTPNFSTINLTGTTFTNSGTATVTTATSGNLTVGTTGNIYGYVHTYPSINTLPAINPLSYDNFWKFNEEFDLLWKSYYEAESVFKPVKEKVVNHPCDIQETDEGLRIELTAVGLSEDDLDIIVDSETLRVAYRKTEDDKKKEKSSYRFLHRSIKKASFDIAWKISTKYNLQEMKATLEKGLLILDIPYAKENKPKKISIGKSK